MTALRPHSLDVWKLGMGSQIIDDQCVKFRVWAPLINNISVKILGDAPQEIPLVKMERGLFEVVVKGVKAGSDYLYILDGKKERPDPVSRCQPHGVHGPSRIVDPNDYLWNDASWKGIPLNELLIYQLHVGTFTDEGTFEAIISRLEYLQKLGITAITLMPVAQFPGERNWGYDGTCLYAPHYSYGGPNGLKALVDACHQREMAVVLEVVYNHLGPEGNYLTDFGPYFTNKYTTKWGQAINYDGHHSNHVRQYFIDNALYWLTEYHIDALRLNAVHTIYDQSPKHLLEELTSACHKQARLLDKEAWIIAESDLNDVRLIKPTIHGGYGIDAQLNDDFHHSLHTLLTDSQHSYFIDFGCISDLHKALEEGFVYDGKWSEFRTKRHGSSSFGCRGAQFIAFIQSHHEIANASMTSRLSTLVTLEQQKLAAILLLCAPNVPQIFMGQEWGSEKPFYYFTSFEDNAIAREAGEEYLKDFPRRQMSEIDFDPQSIEYFLASKLDWAEPEQEPFQGMLRFYRDLIAIRKRYPCLSNCRNDLIQVLSSKEGRWLIVLRTDPGDSEALLICNFSAKEQDIPVLFHKGEWNILIDSHDGKYGSTLPVTPLPDKIVGRNGETQKIHLPGWGAALFVNESC